MLSDKRGLTGKKVEEVERDNPDEELPSLHLKYAKIP
jgi:hypothetical protein